MAAPLKYNRGQLEAVDHDQREQHEAIRLSSGESEYEATAWRPILLPAFPQWVWFGVERLPLTEALASFGFGGSTHVLS
jgi:hypothetical protein